MSRNSMLNELNIYYVICAHMGDFPKSGHKSFSGNHSKHEHIWEAITCDKNRLNSIKLYTKMVDVWATRLGYVR